MLLSAPARLELLRESRCPQALATAKNKVGLSDTQKRKELSNLNHLAKYPLLVALPRSQSTGLCLLDLVDDMLFSRLFIFHLLRSTDLVCFAARKRDKPLVALTSKCSVISFTTAATASGVAGCGVHIRWRSLINNPVRVSTGAPFTLHQTEPPIRKALLQQNLNSDSGRTFDTCFLIPLSTTLHSTLLLYSHMLATTSGNATARLFDL